MGEIRKGALGQISAYNPATKKWKQAHTQGAWVITNYLLQNQKQKVLEIKLNEKQDDFKIKLDKELMFTEGHEQVKNLLHILQTYKSSGAVDRARKFYDKYSEIPSWMSQITAIVKKNRKAPHLRSFITTKLAQAKGQSPEFTLYEENIDGLITSLVDKYKFDS